MISESIQGSFTVRPIAWQFAWGSSATSILAHIFVGLFFALPDIVGYFYLMAQITEADQIIQKLGDIADSTQVTLAAMVSDQKDTLEKINKDLRDLRDSRYRPFALSAGLALAIVMSIASYTYSTEKAMIRAIYVQQEKMALIEQRTIAVEQSNIALREALELLRSVSQETWNKHSLRHERMENRSMQNHPNRDK